jgi:ATP-dependent exoDNAse (exonuclease V) beta subunit
VKPGFHTPEKGNHRVLWWDPACLNLNVTENFGLRHINLLKAEGASQQSLLAYQRWRDDRAGTVTRSSTPELEVVRVTDLDSMYPAPDGAETAREQLPVTLEIAGPRKLRPGGRRFGILLHGMLRDADWQAGSNELSALAAIQEGSAEERAAAVEAAACVLRHPVIGRAAASPRCHRELPVLLRLPQNRILEGVIDLVFMENGRWIVVDYKTDENIEPVRIAHERQLRWYMHALMELTGIPAEGVLLQV